MIRSVLRCLTTLHSPFQEVNFVSITGKSGVVNQLYFYILVRWTPTMAVNYSLDNQLTTGKVIQTFL